MADDSKPPRKKRAPKMTDIDKIIKQRTKNPLLSVTDQAKLNDISKQALSALLKRHGIKTEDVEIYKQYRADLFAGKQEMVLRNIDEPAIKKMIDKHPIAAMTLFNSCFNNERLENGLSTQNSAVVIASAVLEADKLSSSSEGDDHKM